MERASGFQTDDYPLHAAAVATWEGFVFISLGEPPSSFEEMFAPLWRKFAAYNLPLLRSARCIEYDVLANWKLIFENYCECFHCPTIHPQLVKLSPAESGANDLTSGMFLGGPMTVTREGGSMTKSGRMCSIPVGDLPPAERQRVYYYSIFPNLLLSLHHDFVMVHTLWPCSPDRTIIQCEWLFHPDAFLQTGFHPDDAIDFWDQTNRQDWEICERCQEGVASRAYAPGPYSPRESISAEFDREYLKWLGSHSG
jgi:Rieske 2Fe-2S family protein